MAVQEEVAKRICMKHKNGTKGKMHMVSVGG
jgi:hypothetical protein